MSNCSVFDDNIIIIIRNNISLLHLDLSATLITDQLIYDIYDLGDNNNISIKTLDIRNCHNINKSYLSIMKLIMKNFSSLEFVLYGDDYSYNKFD